MRFPYWIVRNSPWPDRMGRLFTGRPFVAWSFLCFIHFPRRTFAYGTFLHELEHVRFFWVFWIVALALWLAVSRSWWLVPLTPFAYSLAYGFASALAWIQGGHAYRDNWFERRADRAADVR